ncbi:hypothetical protein EV426DRAFT_572377 [Tirmania nivea]|nr:hypothetical protein EV426DRAFT_572377 [Tirmania nivea]
MRFRQPRAIAPRPQVFFNYPHLVTKYNSSTPVRPTSSSIYNSSTPVRPTSSSRPSSPPTPFREWSERLPVHKVAKGRVFKRTPQKSQRKPRIEAALAHDPQPSYPPEHGLCAETEAQAQRLAESTQLKLGRPYMGTTQECLPQGIYEQVQGLPGYQVPNTIDTLQSTFFWQTTDNECNSLANLARLEDGMQEDDNALTDLVTNNCQLLPPNETQISDPLNNLVPDYSHVTPLQLELVANNLHTQNSIPDNLYSQAAVVPSMQFLVAPAMGSQMPVNLNLSHELGYRMHSKTPSPSLIPRGASLPVNSNAVIQLYQSGHKESKGCDKCSGFWCMHSECIFRASVKGADQGIRTQLLRSYENLRLHIHEHTFGARETCSLCEDLFYHHTLQLPLLFEVKADEVGQVWLRLGNNLMNLRKHVEEAHGGV